jgi:magnesium transporter
VISAWCYSHDTSAAQELSIDEIAERIDPKHGLVWIDTDEPTSRGVQALLDSLAVNEFAQEDLTKAGQRTKLAHYSSHFHVAVYDCVLEGSELHAREIDIVFAAGWVLTVHQPPEDGDPGSLPVASVRHRFELQRAQHGRAEVGLLLWALLDVIVDRYFAVTDAVDDLLDEAEDAILASAEDRRTSDDSQVLRLFAMGKALVRFRRAAVPLRDVTAEIVRREVTCIDDTSIVHFQDLADHVLRVSEFIESQRDVLTGLRDAELASASNRLSRAQQKIAAWGAILIVATLITGVLGMNFANAPELDWEEGFLAIFGIMTLLGIPIFLYFKKRDWI